MTDRRLAVAEKVVREWHRYEYDAIRKNRPAHLALLEVEVRWGTVLDTCSVALGVSVDVLLGIIDAPRPDPRMRDAVWDAERVRRLIAASDHTCIQCGAEVGVAHAQPCAECR